MKQKILLVLMLIISVIALYFLFNQLNKISQNGTEVKLPDKAQFKIAATFFPIYDIAKNIAGDKAEVIQILPKGASPHTFEPNIQDQQKISECKLVFMNGFGIDNWVLDLLDENVTQTLPPNTSVNDAPGLLQGGQIYLVQVSQNIDLLPAEEEEDSSGFDPHIWLNIANAKIIATNISDTLVQLDPANAVYYQNNLQNYQQELQNTLERSLEKITGLENKQLITFHDAFAYFAKELGLEIAATIEPFPGKEPTAAYLAEVANIINQYGIKVLFKEPQLSDTVVTTLANDYGATVYTLDPEGALPDITTFIELYEYNVDSIVSALK